jgi:hypothetical protein
MPLKLSTTLGKIQNISNSKNIEIVDSEKLEGLPAPVPLPTVETTGNILIDQCSNAYRC